MPTPAESLVLAAEYTVLSAEVAALAAELNAKIAEQIAKGEELADCLSDPEPEPLLQQGVTDALESMQRGQQRANSAAVHLATASLTLSKMIKVANQADR